MEVLHIVRDKSGKFTKASEMDLEPEAMDSGLMWGVVFMIMVAFVAFMLGLGLGFALWG